MLTLRELSYNVALELQKVSLYFPRSLLLNLMIVFSNQFICLLWSNYECWEL